MIRMEVEVHCQCLRPYQVAPTTTNGSLLANCVMSLAGPIMEGCYPAELQLPTDESHCIRFWFV